MILRHSLIAFVLCVCLAALAGCNAGVTLDSGSSTDTGDEHADNSDTSATDSIPNADTSSDETLPTSDTSEDKTSGEDSATDLVDGDGGTDSAIQEPTDQELDALLGDAASSDAPVDASLEDLDAQIGGASDVPATSTPGEHPVQIEPDEDAAAASDQVGFFDDSTDTHPELTSAESVAEIDEITATATALEEQDIAPESDVVAELPAFTAEQDQENLEQPFNPLLFSPEEADTDDSTEEVESTQTDGIDALSVFDVPESDTPLTLKFLSTEAAGGEEPAVGDHRIPVVLKKRVKSREFYACTNKPCRLKKAVVIYTATGGPVRTLVIRKHFVYSSKRAVRNGDLNLTTAFRRTETGTTVGRSAWVFVKMEEVRRFKHRKFKGLTAYEHFQNRQRIASFVKRHVMIDPNDSLKKIVLVQRFDQKTVTDSSADVMAPRKRDGSGSLTKSFVFKNGKLRTLRTTFDRVAGEDKGKITGTDAQGRKRSGTFTIAHRGDQCVINDTGSVALVITHPKPADATALHRVKETLTITLDKQKKIVDGTADLSNGTQKTKRIVRVVTKPTTCADKGGVQRSKIRGRRYSGAQVQLIREEWHRLVHIYGTITNGDNVKKVDFVRFLGARIRKN